MPDERKVDIVNLHSANHSTSAIADTLSIGCRTCQRVLRLWRTERVVFQKSYAQGRPRVLRHEDLKVQYNNLSGIYLVTLH